MGISIKILGKSLFSGDRMWKLMNTRKKNHILHLELNKSLGIIAFITFIKKLVLNSDVIHFSK
jgi:hypothetical protein